MYVLLIFLFCYCFCGKANNWDQLRTYGVRLHAAILSGSWTRVKQIYSVHDNCFAAQITSGGDYAIHVAILARETKLVKKIIKLLTNIGQGPYYFGLTNVNGYTSLHAAASTGNVELAKILHEAVPTLAERESLHFTPLHVAAKYGHREMVKYLYTHATPTAIDRKSSFFNSLLSNNLFGIAVDYLSRNEDVAIHRVVNEPTPLHLLARKPPTIFSKYGSDDIINLIHKVWNQMHLQGSAALPELTETPTHFLLDAIEYKNFTFVRIMVEEYPNLIQASIQNRRTLLHFAIQLREEKLLRILCKMGAFRDPSAISYVETGTRNNILHMAAQLPPLDLLARFSGPALQMQSELLWFKEVKDEVQPQLTQARNQDGLTPQALFTREHNDLKKKGEEWLRNTATACTVVSVLMGTSIFGGGAAFKVPGSDTNATADPLHNGIIFWVFAIVGVLSLTLSTASTLLFLSILTARYEEEDFRWSLPFKLTWALVFLVSSTIFTMISSIITVIVTFKNTGLLIGCVVATSLPVIISLVQALPLLWTVMCSTVTFVFRR